MIYNQNQETTPKAWTCEIWQGHPALTLEVVMSVTVTLLYISCLFREGVLKNHPGQGCDVHHLAPRDPSPAKHPFGTNALVNSNHIYCMEEYECGYTNVKV